VDQPSAADATKRSGHHLPVTIKAVTDFGHAVAQEIGSGLSQPDHRSSYIAENARIWPHSKVALKRAKSLMLEACERMLQCGADQAWWVSGGFKAGEPRNDSLRHVSIAAEGMSSVLWSLRRVGQHASNP